MAIGKNIRFHRDVRLKITLEELSSRSGVDVGTISALEVRDSSRSKFFSKIAQGLGLTLDELEIPESEWGTYCDKKSNVISNKAQRAARELPTEQKVLEKNLVHDSALSQIFDSDMLESIQQLNAPETQMLKNMINKFLKSDLFTRQALNIVISGAQEDAERTLEAKKLEQESRSIIMTDSQNEEHKEQQKQTNPSNS